MTNKEYTVLETALTFTRELYCKAQLSECKVFQTINLFGLEDVLNKNVDASIKPDWLNGDTIAETITCYFSYGEGNAKEIIKLIKIMLESEV